MKLELNPPCVHHPYGGPLPTFGYCLLCEGERLAEIDRGKRTNGKKKSFRLGMTRMRESVEEEDTDELSGYGAREFIRMMV